MNKVVSKICGRRSGRESGRALLRLVGVAAGAAGLMVALLPGSAKAVIIEVIPTTGYQWGANIKVSNGTLKLGGGQNYGLIVDVVRNGGAQIEFTYIRQDTDINFADSVGVTTKLFDVAVSYYQAGVLLSTEYGRTLSFSSVSLGLTHLNPKGVDASSDWRVSLTIGLGTKISFTRRIGVRVHGRLMPTFIPSGADLLCDDDGCYSKLESGAMLQGEVAAGLIVAF